jgi:hypothetical protein
MRAFPLGMHFNIMLRFIVVIFILSVVFFNTADANENQYKIGINGQTSIYGSFVKSNGFPIGSQFVSSFGGGINYSNSKMFYSVFLNKHQSFYSIANGLLLYRDYKGYECGINIRRTLFEFKTVHSNIGGGLMLSGNYDQYMLIKQYMVYPSIGIEVFSSFYPLTQLGSHILLI